VVPCVTFDTNVLDLACRPERFPKDKRQPQLQRVPDALAAGAIKGFYPVTMLTIEGIMRKDRGEVFASTQISAESGTTSVTKNSDLPEAVRAKVDGADVEQVSLKLVVTQRGRKPLHPEVIARVPGGEFAITTVIQADHNAEVAET
jgi:hypothetical protein